MATTEFLTADFSFFQALVEARTEKTPKLEFKRKSSPGQVELQKDDKKLLGEAVSGFANARGGVLVLGIATVNVDGIDQAASISLVENVEAVAARYRAYASDCASPPVEGVEVHSVDAGGGRGLVVVWVPKGQARPHMSRAPGHHTYYRRVMDKFVPMEAYEIEEMMRLKSDPLLELATDVSPSGSIGDNKSFSLRFGLRNVSATMARFPYIEYHPERGQPYIDRHGLDGNGGNLWPLAGGGVSSGLLFAGGADQVIHPGQSLFVSKMTMYERLNERFAVWAISQLPSDGMKLRFSFGCEGHPRRDVDFLITPDLFQQLPS